MLIGTSVNLGIYAPTLTNPIANPVDKPVTGSVEFRDVKDYDIANDAYFVASARIDIGDSAVRYKVPVHTTFQDVGDGFNGYVLTFDALAGPGASIRSVDIIKNHTTIDIQRRDFEFDDDTLLINMSGTHLDGGETFAVRLGFKLIGGPGQNQLVGGDGEDRIRCGAEGDFVFAKGGNDKVWSGDLADTLVFARNDDRDVVFDFDADGADHDKLDLSRISEIANFRDLKNHHLIQRDEDVIIDVQGSNYIRLKDMSVSDLNRGDFVL
jgi:Ca2+-binding RTX toxin-like protein